MIRRDVLAAAWVSCASHALAADGGIDPALSQALLLERWADAVAIVRARVQYQPRDNPRWIRPPAQVWASRRGDCTEQAALLAYTARAAGLRHERMAYGHALLNGIEWHLVVIIDGLVLDPTQLASVKPIEMRPDLQQLKLIPI